MNQVSIVVPPKLFNIALFISFYIPVLLTLQAPDTAGHLCCVPPPVHELCHLQPCDVWPPQPHLSEGRITSFEFSNVKLLTENIK